MHCSYVVISVLNAFQVAIVLRKIQYLRLISYASDDEKDEEKSRLVL